MFGARAPKARVGVSACSISQNQAPAGVQQKPDPVQHKPDGVHQKPGRVQHKPDLFSILRTLQVPKNKPSLDSLCATPGTPAGRREWDRKDAGFVFIPRKMHPRFAIPTRGGDSRGMGSLKDYPRQSCGYPPSATRRPGCGVSQQGKPARHPGGCLSFHA